MPSTTISREDLYERVWSTPVSHLAAELGVSGPGLKKICDRLQVPVPPRGYWARKEAGQYVIQPRLLKAKPGTPLSVEVQPTPSKPPATPIPPLEDNSLVGVKDGQLSVPAKIGRLHAVVSGWIETRKTERERSRLMSWGNGRATVPDFDADEKRQHRILNTLFLALEGAGHKVTLDRSQQVQVALGGRAVSFRLREKFKQVKVALTEEEKIRGYYSKRGYKTETVGTGFLVFEITTSIPGQLRREWLENENQPMENIVSEIFATMQAAAPLLEAERLAAEERERIRQAEEARQREIESKRKINSNRVRRFGNIAEYWEDIGRMRNFLAELRLQMADPQELVAGRSVADWMDWLEGEIAKRDPLALGPKTIFEDLAQITEWWRES